MYVVRALQQGAARRLLKPLERLVRPLLFRRGKILAGSLRGFRFPRGGRGILLGTYELEIQHLLAHFLRPSSVFYDIGAHHGYFTLLGSKLVTDSGRVFSFEPLPQNMDRLQQTIEINKLSNVTPVLAAVADHCGAAELFIGDRKNDYRPSLLPWKGSDYISVKTVTLDSFVEGHPPPNVIKIDVEGAELRLLQGAIGVLRSMAPPVMIVEAHNEDLHDAVKALLEGHSYGVRSVDVDPQRPYPHHILAVPEGWHSQLDSPDGHGKEAHRG